MAGPNTDRHFRGTLYLRDGQIAHVRPASASTPVGFDDASVVECGDALVFPGLIDLHSHLAYNALPLWHQAGQATPYLHRNIWPGRDTYGPKVSWPSWVLAHGAPESLMTYAQVRALAGGTTTIQGWPGTTRRPANQLVRNADDQTFGDSPDLMLTSVLTLDGASLRRKGQQLGQGRGFIYHCAEGQHDSLVRREYDDVADAGCLRQNFIGIHMSAVAGSDFRRWKELALLGGDSGPGSVVWSPFSNLWLYGQTTDVPGARAHGVNVCLGTDWGPSGTKNLLGELKTARLAASEAGWRLSDHELGEMVTVNPGRALARIWARPVGQLTEGGVADVAVFARRKPDPFASLVASHEEDVGLVVVDGSPIFGTVGHMRSAGATGASSVPIGAKRRRVVLTDPADAGDSTNPNRKWFYSRVVRNLSAVRRDPRDALAAPLASREVERGSTAAAREGLQLALDMPGGIGITAGPPPPGVEVVIDPIPSLTHDRAWLRSLPGRGFHNGLLDRLSEFYA